MKYVLRILGLLAIVFALYVIVGEQLVGSSGDAYVNARLSTVRAPMGGTVDLAPLALGAKVQQGETMGSLNARDHPDPTLAGLLEGDLLARADLAAYQEFSRPADSFAAGAGAGSAPGQRICHSRRGATRRARRRKHRDRELARGRADLEPELRQRRVPA